MVSFDYEEFKKLYPEATEKMGETEKENFIRFANSFADVFNCMVERGKHTEKEK